MPALPFRQLDCIQFRVPEWIWTKDRVVREQDSCLWGMLLGKSGLCSHHPYEHVLRGCTICPQSNLVNFLMQLFLWHFFILHNQCRWKNWQNKRNIQMNPFRQDLGPNHSFAGKYVGLFCTQRMFNSIHDLYPLNARSKSPQMWKQMPPTIAKCLSASPPKFRTTFYMILTY